MYLIRIANYHNNFNYIYHFLFLFGEPVNLKAGLLCICYTFAKKRKRIEIFIQNSNIVCLFFDIYVPGMNKTAKDSALEKLLSSWVLNFGYSDICFSQRKHNLFIILYPHLLFVTIS